MVKLFAPAMSLDADGTIGKAMTFSKWKGRNYLRKSSTPANPRTGLQVGVRAMFKFLTENWSALSIADKATYAAAAAAAAISPFNEYVALNMKRWKRFQPPSMATPSTETGTVGDVGFLTPAATGGVASILIQWGFAGAIEDNWGLMIFKGTTGFSTALTNCVAVRLSTNPAVIYDWLDSPLVPATYYYNSRLFTDDGVLGPELGEISAAAA